MNKKEFIEYIVAILVSVIVSTITNLLLISIWG